MNLIDRALHHAVTAHAGQTDKCGQPYILHCLRVGLAGKTEAEMVTGFLHDIIEDTPFPVGLLAPEFGQEIAEAVLSVSHAWFAPTGVLEYKNPKTVAWSYSSYTQPQNFRRERYEQQIARAGANPIGRQVKIHDLLDNLSPARLNQLPYSQQEYLSRKYRVALDQLEYELE